MTPATLLAWRRSHNYTQREAAEALGVALRSYVYWENNQRQIPVTVQKLVDALCRIELTNTERVVVPLP